MQWNNANITRFWDFASKWKPWHEDYFSRQVGVGIIEFLKDVTPLKGCILDYGCGIGDLSQILLNSGIACEGIDSSIDSVEYINKRFESHPLWKGARLFTGEKFPYSDNTFDLILCIENIEHLMPEQISVTLSELRRILKPFTGQLFITTPNEENLELFKVYCPECGSVFHRYQHISSFSKINLPIILEKYGFKTTICNNTHFGRFQDRYIKSPRDWSLNYITELRKRIYAVIKDKIPLFKAPFGNFQLQSLIGDGAHLFWMGTKEGK